MTQLPYASTIERRIAKAIVNDALAAGFKVSVYDGEEWAIKGSTNSTAIIAVMGATDSDTLRLRGVEDDAIIGSISLIWGNGGDLLSDHSDTDAMNAFVTAGRYY